MLEGLGHVSCEVHQPQKVNDKIREIMASEGIEV